MKPSKIIVVLALAVMGLQPNIHQAKAAPLAAEESYAGKSTEELIKAAEEGDAVAQAGLGRACSEGKGVPQDYKKAAEWYTKAAEQGIAGAQASLGLLYEQGRGVPQDYIQAYKWASFAAGQGNENARRLRTIITRKMSPSQLEEAKELTASTPAPTPKN